MKYFLLGVFSFFIFTLSDFLKQNRKSILSSLSFLVAAFILLYSCYELSNFKFFSLPLIIRFIGLILAVLSFSLLIFSLFIEISLKDTYTQKKYSTELMCTGTYALARHPGVLWLFFLIMFMGVALNSLYLVIGSLIFTICNSIYVFIQEKYFLTKIFDDYYNYMKKTPFLIPNKKSIREFKETINLTKKI